MHLHILIGLPVVRQVVLNYILEDAGLDVLEALDLLRLDVEGFGDLTVSQGYLHLDGQGLLGRDASLNLVGGWLGLEILRIGVFGSIVGSSRDVIVKGHGNR